MHVKNLNPASLFEEEKFCKKTNATRIKVDDSIVIKKEIKSKLCNKKIKKKKKIKEKLNN